MAYRMIIRIGVLLFIVPSLILAQPDSGICTGNECERRLQELEATAQKLKTAIINKDVDTLINLFSRKRKTVVGVDLELSWNQVVADFKEKKMLYTIFFDTDGSRKIARNENVKSVRDYLISGPIMKIEFGYHPFWDEGKCEIGHIRYYWEGMSRQDRDYLGVLYLNYYPDEGGWKVTTYSSYY